LGNYPHGYVIADSTTPGVYINALYAYTTYYLQVRTIDTSFKKSLWSNSTYYYYTVENLAPEAITTLFALTNDGGDDYQIKLTWTAPGDDGWDGNIQNGKFRIEYATWTSVIWSTDTATGNGTYIDIDTATIVALSEHSYKLTGLIPETTYYFRIWTRDDVNNWSNISNAATATASIFWISQEPLGTKGLRNGSLVWGDYDNDGDLDLAVSGDEDAESTAGGERLIIYENVNGVFSDGNKQEPLGSEQGVRHSYISWGDYDNDGDLDLAVSGYDSANYRLIIYKNIDGVFSDSSKQEPMGANQGIYESSLDWGDYDNDGDLDLAVSGHDSANYRLIIYKNIDGVFSDSSKQEPMGTDKGVMRGYLAWGIMTMSVTWTWLFQAMMA
jgi:predicted nucleotidyltransferase